MYRSLSLSFRTTTASPDPSSIKSQYTPTINHYYSLTSSLTRTAIDMMKEGRDSLNRQKKRTRQTFFMLYLRLTMPMMRDSSASKLLLSIAAVALSYRSTTMTTMAFTFTQSSSSAIKRYHPKKKCIYHHTITRSRPHQRHNEDSSALVRNLHNMNISRCKRRTALMIVDASSSSSNDVFNNNDEWLQSNDNSSGSIGRGGTIVVPSTPCVRICRYNSNFYNRQVCIGCYREVYEIGTWQGMTKNQKSLTLLDCIERCSTTTNVVVIEGGGERRQQQHESGGFHGAITIEELTRQYMYWSEGDVHDDDYSYMIINNNNDNMESSSTDDSDSKDSALLDQTQTIMQENQHEEDDESSVQQQEVLAHQHQQQQTQIVAKTVESFKLADLYWLESCVISHYYHTTTSTTANTNHHQQHKVDSLAFNHPTASHLLSFWKNTADASNYETTTTATNTIVVDGNDMYHQEDRRYMTLPFRSKRIQYMAEILASGYTPLQLIDNINSSRMIMRKGINSSLWTLEYEIFERWHNNYDDNTNNNNNQNHQDKVCSTMLLCAVSRALPGEPSLSLTSSSSSLLQDDEVGSITPYIIIETSNQFYLAQKLSVRQSAIPTQDRVDFDLKQQCQQQQHTSSTDQFQSLWSTRPFQYSGAINIGVASVIIDMLSDALRLRCERHQHLHTTVGSDSIGNTNNNIKSTSNKQRIIRILDPTCGSGTFLALALMIWSEKYNTTATASSNDTIIVDATGIDSNYKCARGTIANLRHLFGLSTIDDENNDNNDNVGVVDDDVIRQWTFNLYPATGRLTSSSLLALPLSRVTIHANDSVNLSTFVLDKFDCAVANLPWNRNTLEYQGQTTNNDTTTNTSTTCCTNERILLSMAAVLKPGAPLVIISGGCSSSNNTRQDTKSKYTSFNVKECLEGMGFVILGQATIPPQGFQLPASGKKKKTKTKKDSSIVATMNENVQRNSDCLITVAIAPG